MVVTKENAARAFAKHIESLQLQVIIGSLSGGGFHQECSQPYSPVARWMREVDMALNHEGQQHGNLDEFSAIARVPRKGLVVWCGDHTPEKEIL